MTKVTVAPITTTIKGLSSEVRVGPARLTSELRGPVSGDQVRHRLSRAGNRQINRVLHIMATDLPSV